MYDIVSACQGKTIEEKFDFLVTRLAEITKCPCDKTSILNRSLRFFKTQFKKKWEAASRKEDRFLSSNEKWLTSPIQLPKFNAEVGAEVIPRVIPKPGRLKKSFENLSERSKRRRTNELRSQIPAEELVYAAGVSQRAAGNTDASVVIKEILKSPTRASKIRKSFTSHQVSVKKHTPQEALSIFVEGDFTRRQWEILYNANKSIYPCYSLIQKAKKDCYPIEESIRVTETCIEIQLQGLLDHTTSRLCKYLAEVIESCTEEERQNMELISKWGCDGSQQSQFKQKFQDSSKTDSNIFQSSLVPLRLISNVNGEIKIIWQNPVPSSVRFCRPIRIRFVSETKEITKGEIEYINDQIKHLSATEIAAPYGTIKIKYSMLFTMVDGKICNAATDTSSTMRCYICGQTSKDFNKLKEVQNVNMEALKFGLSVLHARIRFFESLLHLAYKIPLRKWQVRTAEEKQSVKSTKERIQKEFREQMGLLVDVPKQGSGNTNDGNTSRRFFADPTTSSVITGVNLDLIKRFSIILEVISSGISINVEKFATYTHTTAKLYVELYGWYPMSPTVHKVLTHGAQVISHAILPIGQLSEEAAEARNKNFRQYRIDFSRKFSREECNRDIMNRLLLSSDPYLSSIRPKSRFKKKMFTKEALDLLIVEIVPRPSDASSTNENISDEYNEEDDEDNEDDEEGKEQN